VPTNKQRREAAQRHLQRQLDRRADLARKRRRNMSIVAAVVAALVVAGVVLLATDVFGGGKDDNDAAAAATSSSPAASTEDPAAPAVAAAPSTNADGSVACDYAPADPNGGEIIDVGTPPDAGKLPATGKVDLTMATNQGDIGLTLDRSLAPCAAESFAFLASKGFFDDTPCHRLVTADTFGVLQCGDPTGSGSGGPSYRMAQEVTPETTYPRGTIAMANSGTPGSTGSQFFLVFNDAQLAPDYSVVGTIDKAGLEVLDKIAKAGDDGSFEPSPGGGAPNDPVQITSMKEAG
jgi:cyclophilin family peptidyl-prolyl cis-trans isomerase